jgi:hypothetical protein
MVVVLSYVVDASASCQVLCAAATVESAMALAIVVKRIV